MGVFKLQIQVTDEISVRLASLQSAVSANANFAQSRQLSFENTNFPSLTGYQRVIQTVGRLGERYRTTIERDIVACERIIENKRALDQQIGQAISSVI